MSNITTIIPAIRHIEVSGFDVFYREAGRTDAPTILLLHGFPTSSIMFNHLIPILAMTYHVLAPDLPGFGFTGVPSNYSHTFETITDVIDQWLHALNINQYAVYIFDYSAPIGLRLALRQPSAITAIISQNGNAYNEGLGAFWDPIATYWASGSQADRDAIRFLLTFNITRSQYVDGTQDIAKLDPARWWLDWTLMNNQPDNGNVQLDLFYDYRTNVALYPKFQEYFRQSQVPLLAVWGAKDIIFVPSGATAFKRDLSDAEIHFLDSGHFTLISNIDEMVRYILPFLAKTLGHSCSSHH